ncbi:hypothetical protein SAMN05720472_2804 [Fibrobacter sp. UWR3]|uniref:hypothetical protein n=1 Tax=Fibrobacter sp. UWR3 TaxID=1896217 RepID=UPI00090F1F2D|nr:hypothetical protein [Fibrobacter sp. UWR3]SHM96638.1 hypothetical protein SAMN05720472_2804 [Fibrobacter sp. UWR3]
MKKLLWTGALALTTMACLTACGDDDSNGTSGGYDSGIESIKTSVCDIKKSDDKWVVNTHPVQETYIWTDDGVVVQYRTNVSSKDGCEYERERRKEIETETDMVYTCEEHILVGTDSTTLKGVEKDAVILTVKFKCEESTDKFITESLDDDDDTGTDTDDEGSVGDDGGSSDVDDDEGSTGSDDEDGDEGGQASDITCNFEKSDDTWSIAKGEGGGEMIVKWGTGKAVAVTKTDLGDAESCQMLLDLDPSDTSGSCDGKFLVMEDADTFKNLTKDEMYSMYCAD